LKLTLITIFTNSSISNFFGEGAFIAKILLTNHTSIELCFCTIRTKRMNTDRTIFQSHIATQLVTKKAPDFLQFVDPRDPRIQVQDALLHFSDDLLRMLLVVPHHCD
jgi:hypothetical protein